MHDRVKHMLDAIIASSDILQAINSVVGIIALFMLELGIIIEAIWAIVTAVFSIGTSVLNAALTDAVYDTLLCIFYCNIASDGTVTATQFANIKSSVSSQIGGVAATAINSMLDSIGYVGLTNAGALGEVTGDCSACDCVWCYLQPWQANDPGNFAGDCSGCFGAFAFYTIAYGWDGVGGASPSTLKIECIFPDGQLAHITGFTIDWTMDDCVGNLSTLVRMFDADNVEIYDLDTGKTDGSSQARTTTTITGLDLMVNKIIIDGQARDYMLVYNFSVSGDGFNPFPSSNC
jgi:hypothetical protein